MLLKIVIFAIGLASCLGYKIYQDRIPNGNNIPHPCKPNYQWAGVGHFVPGGGGLRNPFGSDFDKNGKTWNKCLCEYDSDGDGKTNGEELGDPDCVWEPGKPPSKTTGLSHPGVCEPLDSEACRVKNAHFGEICEGGEDIHPCIDDIDADDGMRNATFLFPRTPVPAKETTYVCQVFEVPDADLDSHAVAFYPIIDNQHVMHHIIAHGCLDYAEVTTEPYECGMIENICAEHLFLWSVGMNGHCLNEKFGFRFGVKGYRKILIQAHWNNPEEKSGYFDASGMKIFYTPNRREHDGGIMVVGQEYINIPPNRHDEVAEGLCPGWCTHKLPWTFNIVDVHLHMHYLGNKGSVTLQKPGNATVELSNQDEYSYDSPIIFTYDTPVQVDPGDEIRTVCHFKSTSRNTETYYGDDTDDEMCYGFLTYYPRVPAPMQCVNVLSHIYCNLDQTNHDNDEMRLGCNTTAFDETSDAVFSQVTETCNSTGETCSQECEDLLDNLAESDPCYGGEHLKHQRLNMMVWGGQAGKTMERHFRGCDEKTDDENKTKPGENDDEDESSDQLCPTDPDGTGPSEATSLQQVVPLPLIMSLLVSLMKF